MARGRLNGCRLEVGQLDRSMKRRAFNLSCFALVIATMTACRSTEPIEGNRTVDIGGCHLHMLVAGRGGPVVVLESGLGDTISSWEKVQPEVAKFARVVAYDRAGLGRSDPALTEPRTTAQIARELRTALHKAKLPPPYVLVGHSMGGFHVRLFAHQFPKEVAGLVLVDPSAEDWNDLLEAQFPDEYAKMMAWRTRDHPEGMKKELATWETSKKEARAARPLPDVPVVLFTGLKGNPGGTGIILKLHTEWLQNIPRATHIVTEKSGHYLHTNEPELVVNAISNIVAGARSRASEKGN